MLRVHRVKFAGPGFSSMFRLSQYVDWRDYWNIAVSVTLFACDMCNIAYMALHGQAIAAIRYAYKLCRLSGGWVNDL